MAHWLCGIYTLKQKSEKSEKDAANRRFAVRGSLEREI
jgi:hypothetical protein